MLKWFVRLGVIVVSPVIAWFQISNDLKGIFIGLVIAFVVVLAEILIEKVALDTIIIAALGTILGLIAAKLIDYTAYVADNDMLIDFMKKYSVLIKLVLGYLGLIIAVRKKNEMYLLDKNLLSREGGSKTQDILVLDTCVLIDGRIVEICETKFLNAHLVVPMFVLAELHSLADSSDSQKRLRGRRGLEVLSRLKELKVLPVKIYEKDFPGINGVDNKLIALAKDLKCKIVTTDFNLSKIASVQNVVVLNINDLAAVLKPVVLPGESMMVFVLKEGKERTQGVSYLDDGTMIVVEDGRPHIGKRIEITVTSILQTSAGRMIFAKPK